jgi:hypothetical protein
VNWTTLQCPDAISMQTVSGINNWNLSQISEVAYMYKTIQISYNIQASYLVYPYLQNNPYNLTILRPQKKPQWSMQNGRKRIAHHMPVAKSTIWSEIYDADLCAGFICTFNCKEKRNQIHVRMETEYTI